MRHVGVPPKGVVVRLLSEGESMKQYVFLAVLLLGLALVPAGRAAADGLPSDAKDEIDQFRRAAARIAEDADAKISAKRATPTNHNAVVEALQVQSRLLSVLF